jgi:hypothetical protein
LNEITLQTPDQPGLAAIASRLRASDKAELDALKQGLDYGVVLHTCAGLSVWCRALWQDDIPLAVTGVIPNHDGTHAPWLVGTDSIKSFREQFKRAVRGIVEEVYRPRFAPLLNYVDARQGRSIRFLQALGFTLYGPEVMGAQGNLFRKFTLEA